MNDEVAVMIRCDNCAYFWNVDYDQERCICDDDAAWQLMVVPLDA